MSKANGSATMDGSAAALAVNPDAIPQELRDRPQWVLWRNEQRNGRPNKTPYTPTRAKAESDDPKTWSTFDAAWDAYQRHPHIYSGIGYVFAADDPYCGVDLDLCLAADGSFLTDWAEQALAWLPSYAEISPSGRGLKVIARGKFPVAEGSTGKTFRQLASCGEMEGKQAELAVWNERRYFAITGATFDGHCAIVDCQSGIERLYQSYWGGEKSRNGHQAKPAQRNSATPRGGDVHAKALGAMLKCTAKMEDGGDGSKRLFACACRAVEHNLDDAEAVATIHAYAAEKPFPTAWSDAEIVQRVRDAESTVQRGSEVVIANFEEIEVEVDGVIEGDDPQTDTIVVPLSMADIIRDVNALTDNWPRRVDATLFVDDPSHGLAWFDKSPTPSLFGYLRRRGVVKWSKGGSYASQSEVTAELQRTARRNESIENTPHEPPIANIYYRGECPKPGDGRHLRWLLDRFRPETTIDRDLLQAAAMTLIWGGPPGARPAFVFTSEHGRGVGKTAAATMLARIVGGAIDVSQNEDGDKLMTRLLTPAARLKRVGLWDNIKSMKLSSEKAEAMITAPVISGRQLYVGEGTRPNLMTWFLTLNGVSMATDLAQRSVIIRLVRGDNSGPWLEETGAYVDKHRMQIVGDLITTLRAEPFGLATYSRWATWEQAVLSRLPEPGEAQRVILERQGAANCDLDEGEIIEQYFCDQLTRLGYGPYKAQVRIPVAIAARWFSWAVNEPTKTASASRRLVQLIGEGTIKRLAPDSSRTYGRGYVWTGPDADIFTEPIANDLPTRIAQLRQDA